MYQASASSGVLAISSSRIASASSIRPTAISALALRVCGLGIVGLERRDTDRAGRRLLVLVQVRVELGEPAPGAAVRAGVAFDRGERRARAGDVTRVHPRLGLGEPRDRARGLERERPPRGVEHAGEIAGLLVDSREEQPALRKLRIAHQHRVAERARLRDLAALKQPVDAADLGGGGAGHCQRGRSLCWDGT